jgi:hypothetical protein
VIDVFLVKAIHQQRAADQRAHQQHELLSTEQWRASALEN